MSYRSNQRIARLVGILLIGVVTLYALRALLSVLDIDDPELLTTDLFQLAVIILVLGIVGWALFGWLPRTLRGLFKNSGLPTSLRCSIEYLRQSLVDSERIAINDRDFTSRQIQILTKELTEGRLSGQSFNLVTKGADLTEHPVEILIAPAVFRRSGPRGVESFQEFIIPFWIPATVLTDGSLEAPERSSPWIPREYLEPVVSDGTVTFGHLSSVDDIERPSGRRFSDYLRSSEEYFQAITGAKPRALVIDGYTVQDRVSIITEGQSGGNDGVTRLYNDILSSQLSPGLLPTILGKNPRRPNRQPKRLLHTGQFESTFPLSPSQ